MPPFIRDDEIATMAEELARLTKARSKTEAVRDALRYELERVRATVALRKRIVRIHEKAAKLGLSDRDFDMKAYTDEMWGES